MNLVLSTQIKYLYEKDQRAINSRKAFTLTAKDTYNLYIIRTGYASKEKHEASSRYIKNKTKMLRETFPDVLQIHEITIDAIYELERVFNIILNDKKCVGYIIQEPFDLPKEMIETYKQVRKTFEDQLFDLSRAINLDIDKTTLFSKMERLKNPDNIDLYPITTRSCINLIHELQLTRDNVIAVVGRSEIVTKPLIEYLIHQGYTVVHINSKTPIIKKHQLLEIADCIVLGAGHYGVLNTWDYDLKSNVFIIDIGINVHPETGKLVGDLALEKTYSIDLKNPLSTMTLSRFDHKNTVAYTPVPGGIGKLTSIGFSYAVAHNLAILIGENLIESQKQTEVTK